MVLLLLVAVALTSALVLAGERSWGSQKKGSFQADSCKRTNHKREGRVDGMAMRLAMIARHLAILLGSALCFCWWESRRRKRTSIRYR